MNEFQVFSEKIKKAVTEYYGEGCMVEVNEIQKNNGIVYHGITVINQQTNISPTIYIDGLYQEYIGGITMGEVVKRVISLYEKYRINQEIDMHFLTDFDWAEKRILYKLIGYERNKERLREIPHIRFLDMAIVFYISLLHDELGSVSILIKNGLCRMWGKDAKELLLLAEKNTPKLLPAVVTDMRELVNGAGMEHLQMHILTNSQKQFGAVCMRYPKILQQFAEKIGGDFWILPSSVHEVILLRRRELNEECGLGEMVKEINETQVAVEEVLTDSVYLYEKETGKISRMSQ